MQCHYDGLPLGRFQCGGSDVAFSTAVWKSNSMNGVSMPCCQLPHGHVLQSSPCLLSQPASFLFRSFIPIPPPTCHISSFLLQSSLYSFRSIFVVRGIYSIITTYVVVGISRTPSLYWTAIDHLRGVSPRDHAHQEGSATESKVVTGSPNILNIMSDRGFNSLGSVPVAQIDGEFVNLSALEWDPSQKENYM